MSTSISGVGVLDKAIGLLVALEDGPRGLSDLVAETGMSRATAHRLAVGLEAHGLVRRNGDGRFCLGFRLIGLGHAAAAALPGWLDAGPVLAKLRADTGESVQLFVRDGDVRVCVDSLDGPEELRTIVPIGARLPLDRGSAGRLLSGDPPPKRGWVESVGERQEGVASVSAPVLDPDGRTVAAVCVSGPIGRISRQPGRRHGAAVKAAATEISHRLSSPKSLRKV